MPYTAVYDNPDLCCCCFEGVTSLSYTYNGSGDFRAPVTGNRVLLSSRLTLYQTSGGFLKFIN